MACVAAACTLVPAVVELRLSPESVSANPLLDVLCVGHFRSVQVARRRRARETARLACMICGVPGAVYAAGPRCTDHPPTLGPIPLKAAWLSPESVQDPPPEPVLRAVPCPEGKTPSTLRSALRSAVEHGWATRVTTAIGPEPDALVSVLARFAHPDGRRLSTRHEGKPCAFKSAFLQATPRGFPARLGWREALAALRGEYDDRHVLLKAMDICLAAGMEIERVT